MSQRFFKSNEAISDYRRVSRRRFYADNRVYDTIVYDYRPRISKKDLDRGRIIRYFTRRTNLEAGEIIEVSESQADELRKEKLYQIVEVPWRISGRIDDVLSEGRDTLPERLYTGVETANRMAAEDADEKMPGIRLKLGNLLEYYQDE